MSQRGNRALQRGQRAGGGFYVGGPTMAANADQLFRQLKAQRRAQEEGGGPNEIRYDEDLFWYPVLLGDMAPGDVVNTTLTIQQDSVFEWIKTSAFQTLDGFIAPALDGEISEVTIQITDNGSGRNLMSGAVPIASIAGTGQLPYLNPVSRFFKPNATLAFIATNTSVANTYNGVTFVMAGRKLFPMSSL